MKAESPKLYHTDAELMDNNTEATVRQKELISHCQSCHHEGVIVQVRKEQTTTNVG